MTSSLTEIRRSLNNLSVYYESPEDGKHQETLTTFSTYPRSGREAAKRSDVRDVWSNVLETTEDIRLINGLGLKKRFVTDLRGLPDNMRQRYNTGDLIKIVLDINYEGLEDTNLRQNLSKELLESIGFEADSEAVRILLSRTNRSSLFSNHVAPINVVKRFVVDEVKYRLDLSSELDSFPKDVDTSRFDLKELNGDIKKSIESVKTDIHELYKDSQYKVLFHGTDFQSACDIIYYGIDVNMGCQKRDFSDGKGFYLTDSFEIATNWALSITQKPVVLIFAIPKSYLEGERTLNLFGESKVSQWKEIVGANRSGILTWTMRKDLKNYDCIEGPVSKVCDSCIDDKGKEKRNPVPDSYQLCVINEDFACRISDFAKTVVEYRISS